MIWRHLVASLLVAGIILCAGTDVARAESAAAAVVRSYFAALAGQRHEEALARTTGQALVRTTELVAELRRQSAAHRVKVELAEQRVDLDCSVGNKVHARFVFDVLGRFMFFKKKVRTLRGEASFIIADGRIVSIDGALAP